MWKLENCLDQIEMILIWVFSIEISQMCQSENFLIAVAFQQVQQGVEQ